MVRVGEAATAFVLSQESDESRYLKGVLVKAVLLMFDSLCRHVLPPYGGALVTPNFQRLAERSVTFDNAYVGSTPCMPARRELHTGRYNFLHRAWGPLEPFDDSMPELLGEAGVYSHLISDHYHYWEDGGATYHTRYSSWEVERGQEGDPWRGQVAEPTIPDTVGGRSGRMWREHWVNRRRAAHEAEQPQPRTFARGLEFLRRNAEQDGWFLQLETFDPHEPFVSSQRFRDLYAHDYDGPHFDWPPYGPVTETPEQVEHLRCEYAALVSMCDYYLGQVLDELDALGLWQDTLLIVTTDHGLLLGEHNLWAKNVTPFYSEIARIPLFVWDPRSGVQGERRDRLTQLIDVPVTLLEAFGAGVPEAMQGVSLAEVVAENRFTREAALYGLHGAQVNCTDGRYTYLRGPATPENAPLYEYTLMPTRMNARFAVEELQDLTLAEPFAFTKSCRTLKVPVRRPLGAQLSQTLLFDLVTDPQQQTPLNDAETEARMIRLLKEEMRKNDAPPEQFERLGLEET